jgi:hypothetical protein
MVRAVRVADKEGYVQGGESDGDGDGDGEDDGDVEEICRFPQCAFGLDRTHLNLELELRAKQASKA